MGPSWVQHGATADLGRESAAQSVDTDRCMHLLVEPGKYRCESRITTNMLDITTVLSSLVSLGRDPRLRRLGEVPGGHRECASATCSSATGWCDGVMVLMVADGG